MKDLTRPIVGIENRSGQEAFDIMVDRINRYASLPPVDAEPVQAAGYDKLVKRLQQYEGQQFETTACYNGLRDEAAAAIIALQGEIDLAHSVISEWSHTKERAEAAEAQLGDLLAIIHRDGGQYQETHGDKKAVDDAHLIWADLVRRAEAAEAEVARLKAELAEAHRVINGVLTFKIEHDASCDHPHVCECGADAVRDMARSFRDGQKTGEKG